MSCYLSYDTGKPSILQSVFKCMYTCIPVYKTELRLLCDEIVAVISFYG